MRRSVQFGTAFCLVFMLGGLASYVALPILHGQATAVAPQEVYSFRDVAKKVLPAVVSIETKAKATKVKQAANPKRKPNLDDPRIPEEFRRFMEERGQLEVPDQAPQAGMGSGFIIDAKGVILTNHHVVAGADQVEVTLMDGRKFTSKDIKSDAKTDLAIVRIDAKGALPYLEMGDSDAMEIGDRVLAAGAPFGLTGSVTAGIVSAKGRNGLSMNMYEDFIQTDAAINPGNSGGPLVNLQGKVVGINSAIKTHSGGFQGVGLAISSNMAKNIMTQLQKDGSVHRGYLGIQIKDLADQEVATRLGVKDHGVVVGQVFEKSPAAKAGLLAGDVITMLDGKPVKDSKDLQRIVAGLTPGKPVDVAIVRETKAQTMHVTVENQPEEFGSTRVPLPKGSKAETNNTKLDKIGVSVTDMTPEMAEQLGYKEGTKGAVITEVERGGLADEAGLRRGMLVAKVEKEPVKSANQLKETMDKATLDKGVMFQVESPQGGTSYVIVKSTDQK